MSFSLLTVLVRSYLGVVVGELSSGYLLVLVLRTLWIFSTVSPQLSPCTSSFRELLSRSAFALALSFSFSRSVWLTGPVLLGRLLAFRLPPSFPLVGMVVDSAGTGLRVRRLASMVPLTGREAGRPVKPLAKGRGSGRERVDRTGLD